MHTHFKGLCDTCSSDDFDKKWLSFTILHKKKICEIMCRFSVSDSNILSEFNKTTKHGCDDFDKDDFLSSMEDFKKGILTYDQVIVKFTSFLNWQYIHRHLPYYHQSFS